MSKTAVKEPSLDERIADTLASTEPLSSEFLQKLYAELDDAVGETDRIARECRAKSIDPLCRDGIAERSKAEDHEFISHRLKGAAEPLRDLYQRAVAREREAAWSTECDDVEMQVAQTADELLEKYQRAVTELVELFGRITQVDKRVDHINGTAPTGCGRRLRGVELVARGIDHFGQYDVKVVEKTVLHALVIGETGAKQLWPIVQPNAVALSLMSMFPRNGTMPPEEDQYYEAFFDEERGCYSERRKADAPPLRVVPPPLTYEAQRQVEEERKAAEAVRWIENMKSQEEGRLRLNAEAEARAREADRERRRLAAGEVPH